MNSYPRISLEAIPFDKRWDVGLCLHDPNVVFPSRWRGENVLGKILMEVRDIFIVEHHYYVKSVTADERVIFYICCEQLNSSTKQSL